MSPSADSTRTRRSLWQLVLKLRDRGLAVVLTTHYIEEAEALCDRVAILEAGRLIALDRPDRMIRALVAGGFRREVEALPATLEDVSLDFTGRAITEEE